MKKVKLKITNGLKYAIVAASLLSAAWAGFTVKGSEAGMSIFAAGAIAAAAFPGKRNKNALTTAGFSFKAIEIVKDMKEKGFQISEDEEKVIKGMESALNSTLQDQMKGLITHEEVHKKLEELKIQAKGITVGEGETAKDLDEFLRGFGDQIKALQEANVKGAVAEFSIKQQLVKLKPEIQKVFKAGQGHVEINITKAPEIMTTQNTVDFDTNSIPVDVLESMSLGAYAAKRYGKQWLASIADRTMVADMEKYTVWDEEGDVEGAFAIVGESGLKPLMSADLVKNFAEAQKVAGKYVITEEFEKFYKRAYGIIQRIIKDKMIRDYEALLRAEFANVDVSYTGTTLDGTFENPNDYDAVGAVAAQIESLNFVPDTLVLHPQDKWRIRLTKNAEGTYLFPVVTQDGQTRMFEFNIVTSTYQTPGTFTLAESGLFKIEEESMTVRIGYGITVTTNAGNVTAVESDFDYNRLRVIVETWFKAYLPTPYVGSAVTASFDAVKADLLAAQV